MVVNRVAGRFPQRHSGGDLLATVDNADDVVTMVGRFMQYYREDANWLERTYAWVPRLGIEKIRAVVVDDAEGLAEGLDARMQKSIDAYDDPWKESSRPVTEGQFSSSLPLIALPQVPVR